MIINGDLIYSYYVNMLRQFFIIINGNFLHIGGKDLSMKINVNLIYIRQEWKIDSYTLIGT